MTPAEDLAVVRARLEHMVTLAEKATPGPWKALADGTHDGDIYWVRMGNTHLRNDVLVRDSTATYAQGTEHDAAFIAAASPDLLVRVARKDLGVLDRHAQSEWGLCHGCGSSVDDPCPEVAAVLQAWLP